MKIKLMLNLYIVIFCINAKLLNNLLCYLHILGSIVLLSNY